jgi:Phosphoesterase family
VFFADVRNSPQLDNLVPFTQFATDVSNNALPDIALVIPNTCDDAHDGGTSCGLSNADSWLQNNVIAPLFASNGPPAFKAGGTGLLIVTFDEGTDNDCGPNTSGCPSPPYWGGGGNIVFTLTGPQIKSGNYRSTTTYLHPSFTRLLLDAVNSPGYPQDTSTAADMGEFFAPTPSGITLMGTNSGEAASVSSLAVVLPTGTVDDSEVVVDFCQQTTGATTPPSGYAAPTGASQLTIGAALDCGVWSHIWHTGDPTSVTFTWATAANASYVVATYSGTSGVDVAAGQANAASTTATASGVTTTQANDELLMLYGDHGSNSYSSPSEGTIEAQISGGPGTALVDFALGAVGATGDQTVTQSTSAYSVGFQVALVPAIRIAGSPTTGRVTSNTQISASLPSGVSNGDWVGCIFSAGASSTLTPPAQYTLVPHTLRTTSAITTGVYSHIWHTGNPTSGLTFQSSASANLSYICAAYSGVNQTSPVDASGSLHNAKSKILTSPSIGGHANDLLLMVYGVKGSHRFTAPSEGSIEATQTTGPSDAWVDFRLTAPGTTGNQTITVDSANPSNGVQIALLPAEP